MAHDTDDMTVMEKLREVHEQRIRSTDVPTSESLMNQRDRWDRPDRGEDHGDTE